MCICQVSNTVQTAFAVATAQQERTTACQQEHLGQGYLLWLCQRCLVSTIGVAFINGGLTNGCPLPKPRNFRTHLIKRND